MTNLIEKHTLSSVAFLIALVLVVAAFSLAQPRNAASQTVNVPINGFAWSDTIGWISFNCATGGPNDTNVCASSPYGMTIDGSGNITGYAWSDNIGWISANPADLSGCPSGPCTATINPSTGAMSGWMRALSGGTANSGGWDGFISLSGSNYGVVENTSTGWFNSDQYAWGGGTDLGWVDFEYASTTYNTCTAGTSYICTGPSNDTITQVITSTSCVQTQSTVKVCGIPPNYPSCVTGSSTCLYPTPSGSMTITPSLVAPGGTAQVVWNVTNVPSCTVTGSNNDGTLSSTDPTSPGVWNAVSGTSTTSPITTPVTYTLSCPQYDHSQPNYTQTITINNVPNYQEQ